MKLYIKKKILCGIDLDKCSEGFEKILEMHIKEVLIL